MNIGVTGATGFIGRHIVDAALQRGHEIIAFSRDVGRQIPGCEMRYFSLEAPPDLRGCDALIHLAGESVAGIWTGAKRRRIRDSRLLGTRRVVEAMQHMATPPEVLVSGSGISVYADGGDTELSESAPTCAGPFLADVVHEWEREAKAASRCRVVLLRTAVVLGNDGGALRLLAPLFRLGLGAQLGDGRQWMSWIHILDEAQLALFAVENMDITGPLNASAPTPLRNAEFTQTLAKVVRRPAFLRLPGWALRRAGAMSEELLGSRRVVPAVAIDQRFRFHFPELRAALDDLLA